MAEERKRAMSLQGMIKKLSQHSEESLAFLIDLMNDPTADVKDRVSCAKFVLTSHATLLAQAEREAMNKQTIVMNNYRIRKEQREIENANQSERLVNSSYKGVTGLSQEIVYTEDTE